MRFRVVGVHEKFGSDRQITVTADNEAEAALKAEAVGISPRSIELREDAPFVYKMVQVSHTIISGKTTAADHFEKVVNDMARDGWEFFRVDQLSEYEPPGCLAPILGGGGLSSSFYVLTFRRPAD